jgi:hypothetical protein
MGMVDHAVSLVYPSYSWNIGVYLGSIIIFTILLSIQKIKEWEASKKRSKYPIYRF